MMHQSPFYKILGASPWIYGKYSISSVRMEDAECIRNWRNTQISALRQKKELSKLEQAIYFNGLIKHEFDLDHPPQILVRFCFEEELIGYGGIVHLDWTNLRGEVSFLLETSRIENHHQYAAELSFFFHLIKEVAFTKLGLNKLSTEAYAHRDHHVSAIEEAGFRRDGVLREHALIEGKWVDAVVASCLSSEYTTGK